MKTTIFDEILMRALCSANSCNAKGRATTVSRTASIPIFGIIGSCCQDGSSSSNSNSNGNSNSNSNSNDNNSNGNDIKMLCKLACEPLSSEISVLATLVGILAPESLFS